MSFGMPAVVRQSHQHTCFRYATRSLAPSVQYSSVSAHRTIVSPVAGLFRRLWGASWQQLHQRKRCCQGRAPPHGGEEGIQNGSGYEAPKVDRQRRPPRQQEVGGYQL